MFRFKYLAGILKVKELYSSEKLSISVSQKLTENQMRLMVRNTSPLTKWKQTAKWYHIYMCTDNFFKQMRRFEEEYDPKKHAPAECESVYVTSYLNVKICFPAPILVMHTYGRPSEVSRRMCRKLISEYFRTWLHKAAVSSRRTCKAFSTCNFVMACTLHVRGQAKH